MIDELLKRLRAKSLRPGARSSDSSSSTLLLVVAVLSEVVASVVDSLTGEREVVSREVKDGTEELSGLRTRRGAVGATAGSGLLLLSAGLLLDLGREAWVAAPFLRIGVVRMEEIATLAALIEGSLVSGSSTAVSGSEARRASCLALRRFLLSSALTGSSLLISSAAEDMH